MEWLDTISVHDFTGVQAKRQWEAGYEIGAEFLRNSGRNRNSGKLCRNPFLGIYTGYLKKTFIWGFYMGYFMRGLYRVFSP